MKSGFAEIELDVPAADVWNALVAPGLRDWYYRLTPNGDFVQGGHIEWRDLHGNTAEASDVLELDASRRLVLSTKFTWSPTFAALDPHRVEWELSPDGDRCRVRMSWRAGDMIDAQLGAEGEAQLRSLRLAVDPAARAEVARLDSIGEVEIRDVTPDRVGDYQAFFDHEAFRDFPSWQFCYCMETHRTQGDEEWAKRTGADNRRDMSDMLADGRVTALLAYVDGRPVGWCNYGETTRLSGVMHRFGLEAADHDGVGSVACFVISSRYRGHGVATRLLDVALERLRGKGLRSVEAYPGRDYGTSAQSHYRGPLTMFLRAGFEPYRETERYVVVRKQL